MNLQSVLQASSAPKANLGQLYTDPHGNLWQYGKDSGSASTKGYNQSRAAIVGVDTVSSSTNGNEQIVFITEASAGWTVGAYAEDWVVVDDGTGSGQVGRIKDNSADTLELYSEYAFATALAVATSDITIGRPHKLATTAAAVITHTIGTVQVTQTASYYVWVLVRGIGLGIGDTAPTAGLLITPSGATAGECIVATTAAADDVNNIGYSITPSATDSQGGLYAFAHQK